MKTYSKCGVRLRDAKYLQWIRGCSCVWGGIDAMPCHGDIVPAHGAVWGRGIKGEDSKCLPMCHNHHMEEHSGRLKINPDIRQQLVDVLNERYCKLNNITLQKLRGK